MNSSRIIQCILGSSILTGTSMLSLAAPPAITNPSNLFLTGNERAIIERFARTARESMPGYFSNSLDHGWQVLLVKAFPKPKSEQLAQAAVVSLAEECRKKTGREFNASQRESLVSAVLRTGSFDSVLKEMAAPGLEEDALAEVGLTGMLSALGWISACVLRKSEVEELKQMATARAGSEEQGVLGIKLERWPMVQVVPGTPAAEAGLRDGDTLLSVNDKEASSTRTQPERLRLLQGPAGIVTKLTVDRAGRRLSFEVKRTSAAAARSSCEELKPGVWLIKIPTFEGSGIAEKVNGFIEKQKPAAGATFIIDLRDNGGGRPEEANGVADLFLSDKVLQIYEFRDGTRIAFKSNPGAVNGRVILLTNQRTGSAAEMLVIALRDNSRGTVVGETTAGALFGKETAELVGGQTILFRIDPTVLSPTGQDYSLTGIPPDLKVPAGADRIPDAVLSRAVELAR